MISPQREFKRLNLVEEVQDDEKAADSNAWKLATYISLVVIVALIIFNVVSHKEVKTGTIESVLILPFDNFTGLDDFEYYVAGLHSGLIGDLGKISSLRVPSRTSSKLYKDADMSIPEIASESGVDAVIEPSISCYGEDSLCVQIKLISAFPEEEQIWVQDYRVAKTQILNFFNNVTKNISKEINIVLTPLEESLLSEARTVDPEAYEAFLKGQYYWEKLDEESIQKALEYFQLAIEIDPEWADPYAGLANAWGLFRFFGYLPANAVVPNVHKYINKALEMDPNSAHAHYVRAIISVWTEWDWEQGEKEFLKSIDLNSNNALCRLYYAHLLMMQRRFDEALKQAKLGLELDPLKPLVLGLYAMVEMNEGDFHSAILHLEKALSIDPNFIWAVRILNTAQFMLHYQNGDWEKWIEAWGNKVKGHWNEEARETVINVFLEQGHVAGLNEMLKMNEKYGNKECLMSEGVIAERYIYLNDYEKAIDHLEKGYEMRAIPYVATNKFYEILKDNPRYIELLKKMNLN